VVSGATGRMALYAVVAKINQKRRQGPQAIAPPSGCQQFPMTWTKVRRIKFLKHHGPQSIFLVNQQTSRRHQWCRSAALVVHGTGSWNSPWGRRSCFTPVLYCMRRGACRPDAGANRNGCIINVPHPGPASCCRKIAGPRPLHPHPPSMRFVWPPDPFVSTMDDAFKRPAGAWRCFAPRRGGGPRPSRS